MVKDLWVRWLFTIFVLFCCAKIYRISGGYEIFIPILGLLLVAALWADYFDNNGTNLPGSSGGEYKKGIEV